MPNPVPIGRGWTAAQQPNPFEKEVRWAVLHDDAEAAFEIGLRHIPILLAVSRQTASKLIAQLALLWTKLANAPHRLVDADRFSLAGDSDQIKLAGLDGLLRQPVRVLAEDYRGAVNLVDALKTGGKVDGIADHRIGPRRFRADGPDNSLAGCDTHADHQLWRVCVACQ